MEAASQGVQPKKESKNKANLSFGGKKNGIAPIGKKVHAMRLRRLAPT